MIPERDRIKTVMTTAEIAAAMERGDYSAEMLLQHLVRRYNELDRDLAESLSDLDFRRGLYKLQSERLERKERELETANDATDDMRDLLREVHNLTQLERDCPVDLPHRALVHIGHLIEEKTPPR